MYLVIVDVPYGVEAYGPFSTGEKAASWILENYGSGKEYIKLRTTKLIKPTVAP